MTKSPGRQWLPVLMQAQDGKCCYCSCTLTLDYAPPDAKHPKSHPYPNTATAEHLKRKADGGLTVPDNLAASCHQCNSERGDMNWVEFKTRKSLASAMA